MKEETKERRVVTVCGPEYLVRPRDGRIMTMKTSSKKHLCIVT